MNYLFFPIIPSWVHCGKYPEGFRSNDLLHLVLIQPAAFLGQQESALRLQDTVEPLQHRVVRQRDLVHQQHPALLHGTNQRTVQPLKQPLGLHPLSMLNRGKNWTKGSQNKTVLTFSSSYPRSPSLCFIRRPLLIDLVKLRYSYYVYRNLAS